eukprot:3893329-Pyramimonas_sp.AAC.1
MSSGISQSSVGSGAYDTVLEHPQLIYRMTMRDETEDLHVPSYEGSVRVALFTVTFPYRRHPRRGPPHFRCTPSRASWPHREPKRGPQSCARPAPFRHTAHAFRAPIGSYPCFVPPAT